MLHARCVTHSAAARFGSLCQPQAAALHTRHSRARGAEWGAQWGALPGACLRPSSLSLHPWVGLVHSSRGSHGHARCVIRTLRGCAVSD
eukprot:4675288-Alexandrium_andersonii.AAC.1